MEKENIKDKKLTFISIRGLKNEQFVVPDYQRGYRWQPKQVEQLLNDLWNFAYQRDFSLKKDEAPYCLQPIVVAKRNDGKWEVIDGQQRLTTINLILKYLEKDCFDMFYDTRNEASNKLEEYYREEAQKTISKWFKTPNGEYDEESDLKEKFASILWDPKLYMAHFIWYNVTDEVKINEALSIDIFDRLNIGKIGLTNAELIKALFMTFIDENTKSENHKYLTQISLGTEWDTIEKTLQQPLFWQFICQRPDLYVTHIEYLFDILMEKTEDKEEKYTFNQYVKKLQNGENTAEELWENVKQLFQLFDDWYNNPETFHYVGYLIAAGKSIKDICSGRYTDDKQRLRPKDEFKQWLLEQCKCTIEKFDLDDPEFFINNGDNKDNIRKVLLLFNILTITQSVDKKQYFMRFPFDEYREKDEKGRCKWDIEHIHSQSDKEIDETWILTMLTYFTGEKDIEKISEAAENLNKEEKRYWHCMALLSLYRRKQNKEKNIEDDLQNIYKELRKEYESGELDYIHSLGNLTLLDKWTNRSYQNAFFPVKRNIIIEQAKHGHFVPICTQNVFLKAYTKQLGGLPQWTSSDCEYYLNEIKDTIGIEK